MDTKPNKEVEAFSALVSALSGLDKNTQLRILKSLTTFLEIEIPLLEGGPYRGPLIPEMMPLQSTVSPQPNSPPFSRKTAVSPKQFLNEKMPKTDVERIACLAYYLTHYRETPHFKTLDLSQLNTEAAQRKFTNAAFAVNNAVQSGLIVPATKGTRQISAIGERFVEALPDRAEAHARIRGLRPPRSKHGTGTSKAKDS